MPSLAGESRMKRLTLTIELLEDLHIGTGTGWGDIDALQVRDRRGWPVLPASHLKGLMRQAANEWNRLDPTAISRKSIDTLFGRQGNGQGQLLLTSAYLNEYKTTLIWGSTQIGVTGTAEAQSLRFIEYIPAGSHFEMQAALPEGDEQNDVLLKAIIARCGRLGGGRNRGHGQVRWGLAEPVASKTSTPAPPVSYPARLRLLLRNLEPVCLARTGHPGNLIGTESFIRGRSLRGSLVGACLAQGQAAWAQTLLTPTLAWGDALPLPVNALTKDHRIGEIDVLPIPLSIGTPKATAPAGQLPWWAYSRETALFGARREIDQITLRSGERPLEKLKRPSTGEFLFRAGPDAPWQRYKPQILERLHTRVPSEENDYEQALFSTEEIAEQTLFLADLMITSAEQADTFSAVLNHLASQWLRIGRGGHPLIIEAATWLPIAKHGVSSGLKEFTLLLESELITRDSLGNFCDKLDASTLARLAGLSTVNIETTQTFSEGTDLFGFNASTGLPRLAQRAIKAGSVIRVAGEGATKVRAELTTRLALGECPEEGFGRFRIDQLPHPQASLEAEAIQATPAPSGQEERCQKAQEWVKGFGKALSEPSNSQWGDFRSRVQATRTPVELSNVFLTIEAAAKKQGGKKWANFVGHPCYPKFRQALASMPLSDAQELLEYFTRWQRALNKAESPVKPAEEAFP